MNFQRLCGPLVLLAFVACLYPVTVSAQCNSTESLLIVRIGRSIKDASVHIFSPKSQDDPAFAKEDDPFSFFESDVTTPIELCVPSDECLTLMVSRYEYDGNNFLEPNQDVIVEYGGRAVPLLGPFSYIGDGGSKLVAQFGNCDVTCNDDESLLELKTSTGNIASYDYYVVDAETGNQVAQCPNAYRESSYRCYWEEHSYFHDRVCLPRKGCYTLVAGESYLQAYNDRPDVLTVMYDGAEIAKVENLQFEAVDFGTDEASCPTTPCKEDEKLVEMFIYRRRYYADENPNMTWALTTISDGLLTESNGTIRPRDRPLKYSRTCAADNPCVRLDLSVPETYEITRYDSTKAPVSYYESSPYRLVIDSVIYGEDEYEFGGWPGDEVFFSTSTYGGACSSAEACSDGESLLNVAMTTGPRDEDWSSYDITWSLYNHQDETIINTANKFWGWGNVLPNTAYQHLVCFNHSDNSCTELGIDTTGIEDGNIASYEISLNNLVLDQGINCESGYCEGFMVTELGGNCPDDGLAKGALAGVVIGATLAFGLVCFAGFYLYRRRKGSFPGGVGSDSNLAGPATGQTKDPENDTSLDDLEWPTEKKGGTEN